MKKIFSIFAGILIIMVIAGCSNQNTELIQFEKNVVYTSSRALEDIRKGEIWLIDVGDPSMNGSLDSISLKYGFRQGYSYCTQNYECSVSSAQGNGMYSYNKIMLDSLNKRNGKGWERKYYKEVENYRKSKVVWKLDSMIYM